MEQVCSISCWNTVSKEEGCPGPRIYSTSLGSETDKRCNQVNSWNWNAKFSMNRRRTLHTSKIWQYEILKDSRTRETKGRFTRGSSSGSLHILKKTVEYISRRTCAKFTPEISNDTFRMFPPNSFSILMKLVHKSGWIERNGKQSSLVKHLPGCLNIPSLGKKSASTALRRSQWRVMFSCRSWSSTRRR
jgi:hypothetical protein